MSAFKSLPAAPIATKKPVQDTRHGITRTDDYAWFRADNWQAMFKDTSILDPEIRAHLEAENAYMEAAMEDTKGLQKKLFSEMRGRLKQLLSKMEGNDKLEALLADVMGNTETALALAKEMGIEAPKSEGGN